MSGQKRIGIDGKWYFNGPPSGARVVRNLIDATVKLNDQHDITIFLDKRDRKHPFPHKNSRVHPVYMWSGNNLIANALIIPFLVKKYKLDVLLLQNFNCLWGDCKKIVYIHNLLFRTHPQFFTRIERLYFSPLCFLARRGDMICTVSQWERDIMANYLGDSMDIRVLHHGIDEIFKPKDQFEKGYLHRVREKYRLPEKYLLYVGRLNIVKNIENLLRAITVMKTGGIPLVLAGAKDWKIGPDMETITKHENLKARVFFLGGIQGKELAAIYSQATLFCFPSLYESFGLPALEAMVSGIPVVVSDRGALPEICGSAGTYINPSKPEDIAAKIDLLLEDDKIYVEKVNAGMLQAKNFTWEKTAAKLLDLVDLF